MPKATQMPSFADTSSMPLLPPKQEMASVEFMLLFFFFFFSFLLVIKQIIDLFPWFVAAASSSVANPNSTANRA
jgi:hypothetical protein